MPNNNLLDPTVEEMISERLSEYYEPEEIRLWLKLPHPQLNGSSPNDKIKEGKANEVIEIIDRLDADAYI